jgi:hypothetical protein
MENKQEEIAQVIYPITTYKNMWEQAVVERERTAWVAGYNYDKWIRVEDGLPEESDDVIMLVETLISGKTLTNIYTGFIDQYQGWHFGEHGEHIGPDRKVTHWQPLPAPPKTEKYGK